MDEDTSKALNFFIHQRLVSESAAKRALETVGLGGAMLTMSRRALALTLTATLTAT